MAQELALTGGAARVTFAEALPQGLLKLLTEGEDYRGAARLIAINPTLSRQLADLTPSIEAAAAPAQPEDLLRIMIEEGVAFGFRDRSDGEYAALYGSYLDALAPLPLACIRDAFIRWNRAELYPNEPKRHSYMPSPAELYTLAERSWKPLRVALFRAHRAAEHREKLPKPTPSADDRAKVAAMLAEMKGQLGAGREMPSDVVRPLPGNRQEVADRLRRMADGQAPEVI